MKLAYGVTLLLAGSALGQNNRFEIVITNQVSPARPAATVEVWAAWDPIWYAFCATHFDIASALDEGGFSGPEELLHGPGSSDGNVLPDGDTVADVLTGQLYWPGSIFPDTSNPILIWRATWSTSDFSPRAVDLKTDTSLCWLWSDQAYEVDVLDNFVEGTGSIHVVPAPAVLPALGFALLPVTRRRREAHW